MLEGVESRAAALKACHDPCGAWTACSRYETGKTKPPLALVKLLRLLDHHPELLDEIRAA